MSQTWPNTGAYVRLTAAAVGWGISATTIKVAIEDLAPLTSAALRFGLGSLLLLSILAMRGQTRKAPRLRDMPLILGLGMLGVTAFGVLYTTGLQWTGAAEATFIQSIAPLVTMGLAGIFLGERIRSLQIVGAAVGVGGVTLLVAGGGGGWGDGSSRLLGDALALGAAIAWGSYSVAVRIAMRRFSMMETSAYSVAAGALMLVPFALMETPRMPIGEIRAAVWLAVAYQCTVSSCLTYIWWNEGVRRIGAGPAAMFSYVSPVVGAITAAVVLGEILSPLQLIGGLTAILGVFIANRARQV